MTALETKLQDCFILEPKIFEDHRGYFFESFNQNQFNTLTNTNTTFVQDNESFSTKGVLRGLHYQTGEHAQAKLVRVIKGSVLDVAVDLRKNSPTFCQYVAVELTETNKKQLFIPRGFAHGFVVLSETAIFSYKCDNFYNKESEGGIIYNDPTLNINWQLPEDSLIVSEKDLALPKFSDLKL
ncbi:MAG: dTDP-4-dehydrorhamnose 3,5-epimerase [Xanthomarina sp.]|jgi:dTDP-4-dehydrorhamnose 3,5-epimerase|uniref:dTDP-4-dehydrorhamnose 3,5-epimerase n=1 Tax=Xanthomarina TaxID=1868329 RepID=UPI000C3FE68A|nr:dTDP-4-dehydrorhamnose 3,5-epimerase [Xanthomarina sp.]MAL22490.1 dTDP-4-dehydrorhamnose 3,5-epimerase [Xanthomarina sp.]MBF61032.1 dTDP-4-dehydrorhamnose 3,5-epimerase [Xanthomarina sp.]HAB27479.1 dTDP-4-dehydrorhamnose 3,5-epimerase [Xanthomarina gelatinilytica]|tara:strand:- start:1589 stop:2134 length:546 start_codon:yes stop_codon:yes gene_type:complete